MSASNNNVVILNDNNDSEHDVDISEHVRVDTTGTSVFFKLGFYARRVVMKTRTEQVAVCAVNKAVQGVAVVKNKAIEIKAGWEAVDGEILY